MKKLTIMIALFAGITGAVAQTSLTVTVQNIKNQEGTILIGVYANKEDFLKKPVEGKSVKIEGNEVTVEFDNLKPGIYAVSVIHDENTNKDLDQNKLGIPKEGYGFSNNAKATMGPPSFDKAKIELKDKATVKIDMKYL